MPIAAGLGLAGRLAGKLLSRATRGRLIGQGGGRELARTAGRLVMGGTSVLGTATAARGLLPSRSPFAAGGSGSGGGAVGGPEGPAQYITEVSASGKRIRKRWSAKEGRYVAVRHLNVLNPRALRRSLTRAEGFERFAKRTVNALHTGPKKFKSTHKRRSR